MPTFSRGSRCFPPLFGLLLLTTSAFATQRAAPPELTLRHDELAALAQLPDSEHLQLLDARPDKNASTISFHRIQLRASGARDIEDGKLLTPIQRQFFLGRSADADIALALDTDGRFLFGFMLGDQGIQTLKKRKTSNDILVLDALPAQTPTFDCAAGDIPTAEREMHGAAHAKAEKPTPPQSASINRNTAGTPGFSAVIGIEIDLPMMTGRFGGSTANAAAWLDEMFLATNLFYQRDLKLQLLRGNTVYDTASDVYSTTNPPELMFQFGAQWRNNHAGFSRSFAMLMSGRRGSGLPPTGLSWTNQYCQKGFDQNAGSYGIVTAGSYGVALFDPASAIAGSAAAELLGHELGHQLGAEHNNCTDAEPGTPGLQSIDKCSNSVASSGAACYTGPLSCPVSGAGLLMSTGCADRAGCSTSRLREFHPVQISLLTGNIASHSPSCLTPTTLSNPDVLYYDGFE